MSDKPQLILDATHINDLYGRSSVSQAGGDQALAELAQKYDLVVTQTVIDEVGSPVNDSATGQSFSKAAWLENPQNATVHNVPNITTGALNAGESSIVAMLDDADNYGIDSSTAIIGSNDSIFNPGSEFGSYSDQRIKTPDLMNQSLIDDVVSPDTFDGIRDRNASSSAGQNTLPADQTYVNHLTDNGVDAEILPDNKIRIADTVHNSLNDIAGKSVEFLGKVLTPAAAIIALDAAANQAAAGDYQGAVDTLAVFGLGEAAGAVGGAAAAAVAARLLANSPHPYLDLSRFDAAPLIAFTAPKETDYGTETDGRISR